MVNRAFAVWLLMLTTAVLNGGFRESVLVRRYGVLPAHQISTVMLCVELLVLVWVLIPWIRPSSSQVAAKIGLTWVVLTLIFEFGAGLAARKSWATMLADYNLADGHIWPLALLTAGLAPIIAHAVRRRRR